MKKDASSKKVPRLGHEQLDPTPVAIPLRFTRKSSLNEVVRQMVRSEELRRIVETAGAETFEEADDFDIGDDYDPSSPYEYEFEGLPLEELKRLKLAADEEITKLENPGDQKKVEPSPPAASGDGR